MYELISIGNILSKCGSKCSLCFMLERIAEEKKTFSISGGL